jgi:hypothetical protein
VQLDGLMAVRPPLSSRNGDVPIPLGGGPKKFEGEVAFSRERDRRSFIELARQFPRSRTSIYGEVPDSRLSFPHGRIGLADRNCVRPEPTNHCFVANEREAPVVSSRCLAAVVDATITIEHPAPVVAHQSSRTCPWDDGEALRPFNSAPFQGLNQTLRVNRDACAASVFRMRSDRCCRGDRVTERNDMLAVFIGEPDRDLVISDGSVRCKKPEPVGLFFRANVVKEVLSDDVSSHAEVYLDSYQRLRFLPAS